MNGDNSPGNSGKTAVAYIGAVELRCVDFAGHDRIEFYEKFMNKAEEELPFEGAVIAKVYFSQRIEQLRSIDEQLHTASV